MKIKAGYRIEVVTWENDGDNYNTKAIDGLTKEDVVEIVKYLKLFEKSDWEGGLGNTYDPDKSFLQRYKQTLQELYSTNKPFWDEFFGAEAESIENFHEWVADGIGYDLGVKGGGDFFTRKVERFAITYTPVNIVIEDVTNEFK